MAQTPKPKSNPKVKSKRVRRPGASELAWLALGDAVAVFGAAAESGGKSLSWCSPAFAQALDLDEAACLALTTDTLAVRLQGLQAGLDAVVADAPWNGVVADRNDPSESDPRWRLAELCVIHKGTLVLRLRLESAQQRATRRHLEDRERLLFTSRSVAIDEMASTLAHELNQPLGAVTNVLQGLKARLATVIARPSAGGVNVLASLAQGAQLALDHVQYAARIIGRIREYTQSRQPRRERVDINALLNDSLALLDWDLQRHGVQLRISLRDETTADRAPVVGDSVMLQQVFVNLMRNAIDAMSSTCANQRLLDIASFIDDAGHVEITIADTGSGIGEDAASQLFAPFFSTKPTGMGLGLNICRSLIELHQGRLWFTANLSGRGCTFHVALPMARGSELTLRSPDAEESASS
ncbi:MAG: sensor histidine kinase [Burkholderiaceae bacterium]|jgi:signal transduction histidine kinase|nr:sensor histidine kinase [Burkholderiaceae bacterium]